MNGHERGKLVAALVLTTLVVGCYSVRRGSSTEDVLGGLEQVNANGNDAKTIGTELMSDEFVALLARRAGISERKVRLSLPVAEIHSGTMVSYFDTGTPILLDLTKHYIEMRRGGHSKDYAMARLQAEPDLRATLPDCRAILQQDTNAYLPWLWLYSFRVDGGTNYTSYVILDGELAWSYMVTRLNDRKLVSCYFDWCDAKEFLPEYQAAFKSVHDQVQKEMKARGEWDQFGSCHGYWFRKKELLKKQGIEWKSPAELHPNTNYD